MTHDAPGGPPVLVGFSQASQVIASTEAAKEDLDASDLELSETEEAQFLASLGRALFMLEEEEVKGTSTVMTTPQHSLAALLQSHLSEVASDLGKYDSLPAGGAEAKFDKGDVLGWARVLWVKLKSPKHPLLPADPQPDPFPDNSRIALLADWGTGLYGAPKIAETIAADRRKFDLLLHLGDVYYSGTKKEVAGRFLSLWPRRSDARSVALNSNHEMYSGGQFYFEDTLPDFGQKSSYVALQNENWLLVGLDTAHTDHELDDAQVAWAKRIIEAAGPRRKVVLFSHHQLFSSLESQGHKLAAKLGDLLDSQRIFAWYWGHEHLCMLYDRHPKTGLIARCLGHGGMPYARKRLSRFPLHEHISEDAIWRKVDQTDEAPGGLVLEGRNRYIPGEEEKFGPHGYMSLEFEGKHLVEVVHEPDGNEIFRQKLA